MGTMAPRPVKKIWVAVGDSALLLISCLPTRMPCLWSHPILGPNYPFLAPCVLSSFVIVGGVQVYVVICVFFFLR